MAFQKLVALLVLILACFPCGGSARDLPTGTTHLTLQQRLDVGGGVDGGAIDCWKALLQLRSCTNEIVLFFLNGEAYLGQDCCRAIRVITRQCWPSMLASVGFTAEEGDILKGYCDASFAALPPPPPSAAGPSLAPVTLQGPVAATTTFVGDEA